MDLSIIIPCYNEVDNIPKLEREFVPVLAELAKSRSVEVIFVDDGCTDGTVEALQAAFGHETRWPVRIERHGRNRGLGAAIRTGLAAAQGDSVITPDSDGTYKFTEIPALLTLLTPGVDIVTASPYHPRGGVAGVPAYRLVLSRGSSLLYRLLVSWRINTYTALFRAYRRSAIANITFQSDGFLAGTELLVKAMLSGAHIVELPAVLHSRVHGVSKAKIMRTIRAHLGFQWRIFLHRLGLVSLLDHHPTAGGSM
jgi:dolichol-phosphate mannosyltransferase